MAERKRGKHMTTPGGLVKKSVYLPAKVEDELREAAHRQRRSESDVLREALVEYLGRLRDEGG